MKVDNIKMLVLKDFLCGTPEELVLPAKYIAEHVTKGDKILLIGEMGAGKTTFTRELVKQMEEEHNIVSSPSFSLQNIYGKNDNIIHMDLYRLTDIEEFYNSGLYEQIENNENICIIEWSQNIEGYDFGASIYVYIDILDFDVRNIKISREKYI